MLSLNCKNVQHVKIYLTCNFEVNLITHLEFLPFFHQFFFLAHLAFRSGELMSSLFVRRSSVNISHFNLLLRNHWTNCNQTLVEWSLDGPLPFQNCVRWSRLSTKMAAKLKIEKRGDAILIVHCCFSVSQNEIGQWYWVCGCMTKRRCVAYRNDLRGTLTFDLKVK